MESAGTPGDFPIQNLPFGVFRPRGTTEAPRVGMAIGDRIVDLAACHAGRHFTGLAATAGAACSSPTLNPLMTLGAGPRAELRRQVSELLSADSTGRSSLERMLVAQSDAELLLAAAIGDYTDFYASAHHATNVGSMFRPDNPLLPNYKWVPIGYHGRASSIVASGAPVRRPAGQSGVRRNANLLPITEMAGSYCAALISLTIFE